MKKDEFLRKLQLELYQLPRQEIDDAIEYYREYLEEAGPEKEEETIRRLGTPAQVARQIKADYGARMLTEYGKDKDGNGRNGKKKGISMIWWVIMGICAAPVALPLVIVAAAVLLVVFIVVIVIIASVYAAMGGCFAGGVMAIIAGIAALPLRMPDGLIAIGAGFFTMGISALAIVGITKGTQAIFKALGRAIAGHRMRKAEKRRAKEEARENA